MRRGPTVEEIDAQASEFSEPSENIDSIPSPAKVTSAQPRDDVIFGAGIPSDDWARGVLGARSGAAMHTVHVEECCETSEFVATSPSTSKRAGVVGGATSTVSEGSVRCRNDHTGGGSNDNVMAAGNPCISTDFSGNSTKSVTVTGYAAQEGPEMRAGANAPSSAPTAAPCDTDRGADMSSGLQLEVELTEAEASDDAIFLDAMDLLLEQGFLDGMEGEMEGEELGGGDDGNVSMFSPGIFEQSQ